MSKNNLEKARERVQSFIITRRVFMELRRCPRSCSALNKKIGENVLDELRVLENLGSVSHGQNEEFGLTMDGLRLAQEESL